MPEIRGPVERETRFGATAGRGLVWANDAGMITGQKLFVYGDTPDGGTVHATLQFDDECRNGHATFSITGDYWSKETTDRRRGTRGEPDSCGCIHELIAEAIPGLAHLIPWHLCSTEGPLHYLENTVFLAGDRDCRGRRAGEPCNFVRAVLFDGFPIEFRVSSAFARFLSETKGRRYGVAPVMHREAGQPGKYQFGPKYTLAGFNVPWHSCPFDDLREAELFAQALNRGPGGLDAGQTPAGSWQIVKIPTGSGEGKARELDAARRAAIWPDATDEDLSADPDTLKAALLARLPALMSEFRRLMVAECGFIWPEGA